MPEEMPGEMPEEMPEEICLVYLQSDAYAERLELLEEESASSASEDDIPAIDRRSIRTTDTAASARSMTQAIMSLYGHQSDDQNILAPRKGEFAVAPEMPVDQSEVSVIVEDHLHPRRTTMSTDFARLEEPDIDVQQIVDGERSTSDLDEVAEAEATEDLWNRVSMHKNNGRSSPSENSVTSTVLTRASNIIWIAYIPGVTNTLYKSRVSRPDAQATQSTLMDKPLPSLPSELSSATHAEMPDRGLF